MPESTDKTSRSNKTGTSKRQFPITLDPSKLTPTTGTGYPPPFDAICKNRSKIKLGDLFGLDQFGVNITRLPPGQASSQRHWHMAEDEFIYILSGTATLLTDAGESELTAGMVAGFKAGIADGHQLLNKSDQDVIVLEIGSRSDADEAFYPDIDLHIKGPRYSDPSVKFTKKDGSPI